MHQIEQSDQGEYTALVAFRKRVFELLRQEEALTVVRLAIGTMRSIDAARSSSGQDQYIV